MRQPAAAKPAHAHEPHPKAVLIGLALIPLGIFLGNPGLIVLGLAVLALGAYGAGFFPLIGRWRLELLTGLAAFWAWTLLPPAAEAVLLAALAVLLSAARLPYRDGQLGQLARLAQRVRQPYQDARLRRRLHRACRNAAVPTPRTRSITRTAIGPAFHVTLPAGMPADWLAQHHEHIANTFSARTVRVHRDPGNARRATLQVVCRDPFANAAPTPWPLLNTEQMDVWQPVPVGYDEHGQQVTLNLFTPGHGAHSLLLGGIPGSGKSTTINMLAAAAARDPRCQVMLIDGKHPGLKAWQQAATIATGGVEARDADRVLEAAKQWMEASLQRLDHEDRDQVQPGDPVALLIFDETSTYFDGGKGKTSKLLESLVKRGRAAGLAIIVATQKPDSKAVPTGLRDNVDTRIAHNVMAPAASDTILGQGMAAAGHDASQLTEDQKGAGLLSKGGQPFKFRTFYVSADDARAIAKLAAEQHPPATHNTANDLRSATGPVPALAVPGESGETGELPATPPTGAAVDSPVPSFPVMAARAPAVVVGGSRAGRSPSVKQLAVEAALLADPGASNRAIARDVGVDHKTVGAARRRLDL